MYLSIFPNRLELIIFNISVMQIFWRDLINTTRQISPFHFALSVTLFCLMHQFVPFGKGDDISPELWMDSDHMISIKAQTKSEFRHTSLRIQITSSHTPKIIQYHLWGPKKWSFLNRIMKHVKALVKDTWFKSKFPQENSSIGTLKLLAPLDRI